VCRIWTLNSGWRGKDASITVCSGNSGYDVKFGFITLDAKFWVEILNWF
jgi:hypothetical protein